MLKVTNLSKSFSGHKVVKNVSFDIDKHQIVGLLGPNGAGKTTLMRLLTGFYPSKKGSISWSKDIKHIGYLPENNPLYPFLTPYQYLKFICKSLHYIVFLYLYNKKNLIAQVFFIFNCWESPMRSICVSG